MYESLDQVSNKCMYVLIHYKGNRTPCLSKVMSKVCTLQTTIRTDQLGIAIIELSYYPAVSVATCSMTCGGEFVNNQELSVNCELEGCTADSFTCQLDDAAATSCM